VWFDSHCHLYECAQAPVTELIERARRAGVRNLLVAGADAESSRSAARLALIDGVVAAVGVHPSACAGWEPSHIGAIEALLDAPGVVAVGETGLDFYRQEAPPELQRDAFTAHIRLARAHDKALVVHTRDSAEAALDLLEREGFGRAVFHCWSGDGAQMERALGLGAYVSFAGNITFKSAGALRELSARVPPDRLLVETDSPWLTPAPHRGRANEPANVVHVGGVLSETRGTSPEDLARSTSANARRLFGLHE
jgi:TatD DNase family protein